MFRRAENVSLEFRARRFSRSGRFLLTLEGRRWELGRIPRSNARRASQYQSEAPLHWGSYGGLDLWQFRDVFYLEDEGLTAHEITALVTPHPHRRRARASRAKSIISQGYRRIEQRDTGSTPVVTAGATHGPAAPHGPVAPQGPDAAQEPAPADDPAATRASLPRVA